DRESDEGDQQAEPGGGQGREDAEPEDGEDEVDEQIERLDIGAALDQRCQNASHAPNLAPALPFEQPDSWRSYGVASTSDSCSACSLSAVASSLGVKTTMREFGRCSSQRFV